MEKEQLLSDAVTFFKAEPVYRKLFHLFRKKYESLGRIGGTVTIREFSGDELESIGRFFGHPGNELLKKGTIHLSAFELQLQQTKFQGILLHELLETYFGEEIISKKEQRVIQQQRIQQYFKEKKAAYPRLTFWLDYLEARNSEGRWIMQMAEREPGKFADLLRSLDRAAGSLPTTAERLPMFSQRITGDPHAFDLQTDLGRMFLHMLAVKRSLNLGETFFVPTNTVDINELFESCQLYRDDLLNNVTCANLMADTIDGVHAVWEAAARLHTVQIVPLRELVSLKGVRPTKGDKVFIVENSGICSVLLDQIPEAPIICTNGQFNLASWTLLDLLAAGVDKYTLYYAGDLDPEGLRIADRLVERYGEAVVKLWHMDVAGYEKSNPQKPLSKERLEKLNGLKNARLKDVASVMMEEGKAGYQEALVDEMIIDLRKEF